MGSGIEFERLWLEKIKKLNPDIKIIDSSTGISLVADGAEPDPHIWLSPKNVIKITKNIRDGLRKLDPENAGYYQENAESYISELQKLDEDISALIESSETRLIMVSHPAWIYYARDYGLDMIAISEGGKEPTPTGIKKMIDEANAHNIKTVFISPEFSEANARAVANEIGGSVAIADPLAEDYIANMRKVSKAFSGGSS